MRFLYYDRITEMSKGRSIVGIKAFPLSEEFFRRHFSRKAVVPGVIFIEAMAQLLGWLIVYSHDFKLSAIMSLVQDIELPPPMRPGFSAEIRGEIITTTKRDSLGRAEVYIDGRKVAVMNRIIYSHFRWTDPEELKSRFEYYSGINIS